MDEWESLKSWLASELTALRGQGYDSRSDSGAYFAVMGTYISMQQEMARIEGGESSSVGATFRARVTGKTMREGSSFAELHVKRTAIPYTEGVIPMSPQEAEQFPLRSFVTVTTAMEAACSQ